MKKLSLTICSLFLICHLNAQLSFTKKATFDYYSFYSTSLFTYNNETIAYSMEIVNEKDVEFTIIGGDLNVKKTFTIPDCAAKFYEYEGESYYDYLIADAFRLEDYSEDYTYITQTLFNDDEKFEIVRIIAEFDEDIEDYWIVGAEVVSEDGTILATFTDDMIVNDYYLELPVLTLESKNFLCFYNDENNLYEAFSINKNNEFSNDNSSSSEVSFVSTTSLSKAYPNPIRHKDNLTIEINNSQIGSNSYVEFVDLYGRTIIK